MIVGSMLDEPEYIKIIEDLGGLVVTDSQCLGTRYFWDLVDENKNPAYKYLLRFRSFFIYHPDVEIPYKRSRRNI